MQDTIVVVFILLVMMIIAWHVIGGAGIRP